jgi:hypothetical protein
MAGPLFADITSVSATLLDSPTTLTDGRAYFLAGVDYRVRVQATAPDNTTAADWNQIILELQEAGAMRHRITVNIETASVASSPTTICSVTDNTAVYSNLDFTVTFRLRWDLTAAQEFAWGANQVYAFVSEDAGTPNSGSSTINLNYGICASTQVLNFQATGVAADNRVNPWHAAYTVTGQMAYYVADRSITNLIEAMDPGEILVTAGNEPTLMRNGAATSSTDNNMADGCTFAVAAGAGTLALGDHYWQVRTRMATGTTYETTASANSLDFNCNRVEITGIEFINGGGTGPTSTPATANYYRSVHQPGTLIRLAARLQDNSPSLGGDRTMRGNTTITVENSTTGATFTAQITSGSTVGTAVVTTPVEADIADGTTQAMTYRIIAIADSAYDDEQNSAARIVQPANPVVYWDDYDPPGYNDAPGTGETPFTTIVGAGYTQTATSIRFTWTPLSSLPSPPWDGDFYTYRIYYRASTETAWTMVDRSTTGFGPAEAYDLSNINTGTATITGLQPLTQYHYFITAIDLFGQEVEHITGANDSVKGGSAGDYAIVITNPSEILMTISDGITTWDDDSFNDPAEPVPANRPLRLSAIKVSAYVVTAEGQPDSMNIIVAAHDGSASGGVDLVIGGILNPAADYDVIACAKTTANTWSCFIPTTNRFMGSGNNVRFIIEAIKDGISTFSDHDADFDPAELTVGNPNDMEWTFTVQTPTDFTPWPARILNNVIDNKNRKAYPAYYLTEDARVTIRVYDVKGRPVATLLDNALRKSGQNIRENGWDGSNKAGKKLGPGLYYVHIHAVRVGGKKVLINKFLKVVMAR